MLLKRRDLLLYCFDPNHARAIGLPVRVLHYGLLVLLSLTIVGSLKAVGIILVIAMLVAPGAIAYLLTDSFERMLVIAAAVAIALERARHDRELPHRRRDRRLHRADPGVAFVLAFLFAPKRGSVWEWRGAPAPSPARWPMRQLSTRIQPSGDQPLLRQEAALVVHLARARTQ